MCQRNKTCTVRHIMCRADQDPPACNMLPIWVGCMWRKDVAADHTTVDLILLWRLAEKNILRNVRREFSFCIFWAVLCKFWDFHSGVIEGMVLLAYDVALLFVLLSFCTFWLHYIVQSRQFKAFVMLWRSTLHSSSRILRNNLWRGRQIIPWKVGNHLPSIISQKNGIVSSGLWMVSNTSALMTCCTSTFSYTLCTLVDLHCCTLS